MNTWKPTQKQCNAIKAAAARECGTAAISLEIGVRGSLHHDQVSMNIAIVSREEHWDDTDLFDFMSWSRFRAGVPLTPDGRAVIDFYIRPRFAPDTDLLGNVTAIYENGRLVRVEGYPTVYEGE